MSDRFTIRVGERTFVWRRLLVPTLHSVLARERLALEVHSALLKSASLNDVVAALRRFVAGGAE